MCSFVNVELCGEPGNGIKSTTGTLLLENPKGSGVCTIESLENQVKIIVKLSVVTSLPVRSRD